MNKIEFIHRVERNPSLPLSTYITQLGSPPGKVGFSFLQDYPRAGAIPHYASHADTGLPVFCSGRWIGVGIGLQAAGQEVGSQRHFTKPSIRIWLAPHDYDDIPWIGFVTEQTNGRQSRIEVVETH